jgi:oxygen-dependent protoporphyrinogen oxidase
LINEYSVYDYGPNTIRDKTGSVLEMIKNLGLEDEMITISEASKIRYIVRGGKLVQIKQALFSFLISDLLSWRGKMELISEPFKKAIKSEEDESIGEFLERRIGKESVEYLADPFFSGIYAGDIYSMSKNKLLDRIVSFEKEYGSIFKGFFKSRKSNSKRKPQVISFKSGVQKLTNTLSLILSEQIKHEKVETLNMKNSKFQITTSENVYEFDKVISCIPAYQLEKILNEKHSNLKKRLLEVDYPPMLSTQLVFRKEDLNLPEKGFGFLIPRREKLRLLGAIWKSNIFPSQTKKGCVHVNLMTGGAHDTEIDSNEIKQIEKEVLREFLTITETKAVPLATSSKLWKHSIPQFNVGYKRIDDLIDKFEMEYNGLYVAGNFRWGVSVSDCIDGAQKIAEEISN